MTCESVRRDFSPFLFGELSFEEEEAFQQHLDACPECQQELDKERALRRLIEEADADSEYSRTWDPSAELLSACRRELTARISAEHKPRSRVLWNSIVAAARLLIPTPVIWRLAAALALVAIGFFGSRVWERYNTPVEASSIRVRDLRPDAVGNVRLVLEETRQKVLSGRLDDERIQNMLLAAAVDPRDPGLRAMTMDVLKNHGDSVEVRQALLQALQQDPNAGVRLKALEGLKPFARDPETRRVLSGVLLADDNPGVRTQAIDLLVDHMQAETIGTLQELMVREQNPYVRQRSLKALKDMNASPATF